MLRSATARSGVLWALLTVAGWVTLAVVGNVLVPQLERVVEQHARAFMPADAPSSTAVRREYSAALAKPPSVKVASTGQVACHARTERAPSRRWPRTKA